MAEIGASLSGKLLNIVLLLLLTSACSKGGAPPGAGKPSAVPVKLQNVETGTKEESSEFIGNLEASARVDLKPEVDGRVTQILVSSGNRVGKGTPIVQLRPEKSQAEVGGAIANVNAARASLNNAQAQLKAAQADRLKAVADLELQNQQYTRISRLVSQGAIARQQLDQVQRDRAAASASLNAAEENIRAARATIDQENSTLQQAQANVALRTEELKDTRVVAPIAGVVGNFTLKLGTYVQAGDTLTTITQNDTFDLNLKGISADKASQLRIGLPVQLLDPQDDKKLLATGQISFVSPQVTSDSQSLLAKASFPNPEGKLRDGQNVQARVIWKRIPGVLIPTSALTRVAGKPFVYVAVQEPGKPQLIARQKPVNLDESRIQGNSYPVIEGLKPGEKLIVSGIQNLSDGAPIKPES
ncbi:MAG TPA: efflux RND transporter periplasmic adaptor subunit [Cyanobacteria bacterium UBA8543]|nr:efflux RND transporter periplasmic adaptor subunit [Cyanobacteria bacterium UBA8543]